MNQNLESITIEEVLGEAFVTYALASIVDRAIPENRDGCKPVQRRILYAMHDLNLYPNNKHIKVQKIAGDVSGKYHPHGDVSVADAIFRMGQDWVMRYPLIDPQGNFGSPDDPPAAPRYPEARLTQYGALMLGTDMDKDIIQYRPTYDDSSQEPCYLPSLFPNSLCNGQNGIAVAMTSSTVSHNLTEVCQAIKLVAKDPEASIDKIMKVMPGPDFPTGGFLLGTSGIKKYFETGVGSVYLQGKAEVSNENGAKGKIIISELPYGVSPSSFIENIEKLKESKKNDDIDGVDNLSDKNGMKIEITLKRGSNPQIVLNNLYKHTNLRVSISVINNFINENGTPVTCNIKQMIESYINHRINIILNRNKMKLEKAEKRLHIVEGVIKALLMIDKVIDLIKKSKNREDARQKLIKDVKIDEIQANSILDMQLSRLTNLGVKEFKDEKDGLIEDIKNYKNVINNKNEQVEILCSEVDKMAKEVGDHRRTVIIDKSPEEIKIEDLVENEKMVIIISKDGFAKRVSYNAYKIQNRGGKGVFTNDEELDIESFFIANTHDELLLFSANGHYYKLNVLDIQQSNRQGKGVNISKLINISEGDFITAALINRECDSKKQRYITTCTNFGFIKRTNIEEYQTKRVGGSAALKLEEGDFLRWAVITEGDSDLIISTNKGYSVRFQEREVREVARVSKGVAGIKLDPEDHIVSFIACRPNPEQEILTVSENGFGKRTLLDEFRLTARKVKGVKSMNLDQFTGNLVAAVPIDENSKLMVLTEKNKTIKLEIKSIRKSARITKGVKIINLDSDDKVMDLAPIVNDEIV